MKDLSPQLIKGKRDRASWSTNFEVNHLRSTWFSPLRPSPRPFKVLLVENETSTREVTKALLQSCDYEVVLASDGMEAWEILVNLNVNIDIILTELNEPSCCGIDLLFKIHTQKCLSSIPVIVMSSENSAEIMFKSLSEGADQFLVKPIRKNDIKCLWQHVWRKFHFEFAKEKIEQLNARATFFMKNCENMFNSHHRRFVKKNDDLNKSKYETKLKKRRRYT